MTALIELEGVSRSFQTPDGPITAVNDVSLAFEAGEAMCLVGESGCGKTTTGRMLAGLLRPTSGRLLYDGKDVWLTKGADLARFRRAVQLVHQDPYASLNPTRTVYSIKRFMGRRHSEVETEEKMVPYKILGGAQDYVKVKIGEAWDEGLDEVQWMLFELRKATIPPVTCQKRRPRFGDGKLVFPNQSFRCPNNECWGRKRSYRRHRTRILPLCGSLRLPPGCRSPPRTARPGHRKSAATE